MKKLNCRLWAGETKASLCMSGTHISGQWFEPDEFTAYVDFQLAHAFPVVTQYGTAIHHTTLARSYRKLMHRTFNLQHKMKAYDKSVHRDRNLGTVVAVELSQNAEGRSVADLADMPGSRAMSPGVRCVAAISKMAEGVDEILGSFMSGREPWSVSMEVSFVPDQSAFAVPRMGGGWSIIPWKDADKALRETFDSKRVEIRGTYRGQRPTILMNGVDGQVNFMGVGLVHHGAEPEAHVKTMLAEDRGEAGVDSMEAFRELAKKLGEARAMIQQ